MEVEESKRKVLYYRNLRYQQQHQERRLCVCFYSFSLYAKYDNSWVQNAINAENECVCVCVYADLNERNKSK